MRRRRLRRSRAALRCAASLRASLAVACLLAAGCDVARIVREGPGPIEEPTVVVGVILPEDSLRSVDMSLPAGEYVVRCVGRTASSLRFTKETACRAAIGKGNVAITFPDSASAGRWSGNPVSIVPRGAAPARRAGGILVRGMVAGRSFHWRKRIDRRMPGVLLFYGEKGESFLTVVDSLPAETYVSCVVTSELSGHCPESFLHCQAVIARTWLVKVLTLHGRHAGRPFDICNDDHCQRYHGSDGRTAASDRAVRDTRGVIIRSADGALGSAVYSKCCGGIAADPRLVWGKPIPGCRAAVDGPGRSRRASLPPMSEPAARLWLAGDSPAPPGKTGPDTAEIFCSPGVVPEEKLPAYLGSVDEAGPYFRWVVSFGGEELAALLRRREQFGDLRRVLALEPAGRGPSGRLYAVAVRYRNDAGEERRAVIRGEGEIRKALHPTFLCSSAFVVDDYPASGGGEDRFVLRGGGWGHGVGLCQIGALGMALRGCDMARIISHYYDGMTLCRQYP